MSEMKENGSMKKKIAVIGIAAALLAGSSGVANAEAPNTGSADFQRIKVQIDNCIRKIAGLPPRQPAPAPQPRNSSKASNPAHPKG